MTKEGKTVLLAILTLFAYAFFSFFEHQVLLFPIPLNSAVFLAVALYFSYLNYRKQNALSVLVSLIGFTSVFSNEIYWSMFLGASEMVAFSKTVTTDFIKIAYYIGLLCWIVVTFKKTTVFLFRVFGVFAILLVSIGAILNSSNLELAGLFFPFIYSIRFKEESELLKLWILLFVLEATKVWSLGSLM
jgi:hypothetical protein